MGEGDDSFETENSPQSPQSPIGTAQSPIGTVQVLPPMSQATSKFTLGSLGEVDVVPEEQATSDTSVGIVYKMADRPDQTRKLQEFFADIHARHPGHKYDVISIALDDPEKLSRTYALSQSFKKTEEHFLKYDMLNVFNIVVFDRDQPSDLTKATQHDLFREFLTLTVADVRRSNRFYATQVTTNRKSLRDNLQVTAQYFENNCSNDLRAKVTEQYTKFPRDEQGGPLFFKLMVDMLLLNNTMTPTILHISNCRLALRVTAIPFQSEARLLHLQFLLLTIVKPHLRRDLRRM